MADSQAYVDFFKEADVNGDGELSLQELIDILKKHGYSGSDQEIAVSKFTSKFCASLSLNFF